MTIFYCIQKSIKIKWLQKISAVPDFLEFLDIVRIPMMSAAYSDASRPAVLMDVGRVFRLKSATP